MNLIKLQTYITYLESRLNDPDFWQAIATLLTALGGHYVLALTPIQLVEVSGFVFATLHGLLPNVVPSPPTNTSEPIQTTNTTKQSGYIWLPLLMTICSAMILGLFLKVMP
jgi:hypothetical protein